MLTIPGSSCRYTITRICLLPCSGEKSADRRTTSVARDPLLVFGDRLTSPSVLLNESRVDPELHARE